MTILSKEPDGAGFYSGFRAGDPRQINVRQEGQALGQHHYKAYVGGCIVPNPEGSYGWETKGEAEAAAIAWAEDNPDE